MSAFVDELTFGPVIGSPRTFDWIPLSSREWTDALPSQRGVPKHWLLRGMTLVPAQTLGWSCGINSAARFAAMLGQAVDYGDFVRRAPNYNVLGNIIGGNAERLQNLLREHPKLEGSDISQRCTPTFDLQFDIINRAVELGRPAMCLLVQSGTDMHWVNVVGQYVTGDYVVLDTNGQLYRVPNGSPEIHHMMRADDCWAQRMSFVSRYNSITCTELCRYKDDPTTPVGLPLPESTY